MTELGRKCPYACTSVHDRMLPEYRLLALENSFPGSKKLMVYIKKKMCVAGWWAGDARL